MNWRFLGSCTETLISRYILSQRHWRAWATSTVQLKSTPLIQDAFFFLAGLYTKSDSWRHVRIRHLVDEDSSQCMIGGNATFQVHLLHAGKNATQIPCGRELDYISMKFAVGQDLIPWAPTNFWAMIICQKGRILTKTLYPIRNGLISRPFLTKFMNISVEVQLLKTTQPCLEAAICAMKAARSLRLSLPSFVCHVMVRPRLHRAEGLYYIVEPRSQWYCMCQPLLSWQCEDPLYWAPHFVLFIRLCRSRCFNNLGRAGIEDQSKKPGLDASVYSGWHGLCTWPPQSVFKERNIKLSSVSHNRYNKSINKMQARYSSLEISETVKCAP